MGTAPPWPRKAGGNQDGGSTVAAALKSQAAPVPRPMRVNMLKRRVRRESQARSKKGQPPQRTTGADAMSCSQASGRAPKRRVTGWPGSMSAIDRLKTKSAGTKESQKRRVMFSSSGLRSSASGIPPTASGSSAMPQMGQGTGDFSLTSGSIGHTQTTSAPGAGTGGDSIPLGPPERKDSGPALNLSRHRMLQKWKAFPPCSWLPPRGAKGFTSIPQTGSFARKASGSASKRSRQPSPQNAYWKRPRRNVPPGGEATSTAAPQTGSRGCGGTGGFDAGAGLDGEVIGSSLARGGGSALPRRELAPSVHEPFVPGHDPDALLEPLEALHERVHLHRLPVRGHDLGDLGPGQPLVHPQCEQ